MIDSKRNIKVEVVLILLIQDSLKSTYKFKEINLTTNISGKVLDKLMPVKKTQLQLKADLKQYQKVSYIILSFYFQKQILTSGLLLNLALDNTKKIKFQK